MNPRFPSIRTPRLTLRPLQPTDAETLHKITKTEVGYLLGRPFWGKGYATEAALASLHFGFEHCCLDHIIALVHPDNLASRRVIEKCGMTYDKTISLWGIELMRYRIFKGIV